MTADREPGPGCLRVRERLSAAMDGEPAEASAGERSPVTAPPDLGSAAPRVHLAACADCRQWQSAAHALTRRVRVDPPSPSEEVTLRITAAAVRTSAGVRRRIRRRQAVAWVCRAGLVVVGAAQLRAATPALLLRTRPELVIGEALHMSRELAALNIALAVGMLVVAVAPSRALALLPVFGAAAVLLVATAAADLRDGATTASDERAHLLVVLAVALMGALTRLDAGLPLPRPGRWRPVVLGAARRRSDRGVGPLDDLRDHVSTAGNAGRDDQDGLRARAG